MYLHPHVAQRLAKERQRELLAQAAEQRRARQPAALTTAPGRARRARRRLRQAVLDALPLRTEPQ